MQNDRESCPAAPRRPPPPFRRPISRRCRSTRCPPPAEAFGDYQCNAAMAASASSPPAARHRRTGTPPGSAPPGLPRGRDRRPSHQSDAFDDALARHLEALEADALSACPGRRRRRSSPDLVPNVAKPMRIAHPLDRHRRRPQAHSPRPRLHRARGQPSRGLGVPSSASSSWATGILDPKALETSPWTNSSASMLLHQQCEAPHGRTRPVPAPRQAPDPATPKSGHSESRQPMSICPSPNSTASPASASP